MIKEGEGEQGYEVMKCMGNGKIEPSFFGRDIAYLDNEKHEFYYWRILRQIPHGVYVGLQTSVSLIALMFSGLA